MNNVGNHQGTRELLIAVVEKEGAILMRKKPEGTPPYKETWYSLGCDRNPEKKDEDTIIDYLKETFGITVHSVVNRGQDEEIKMDHDGIVKRFIYTDFDCLYLSGELKKPEGIEKLQWIPKDELPQYDIVPPSQKLFGKLGFVGF